MQSTSQKLTVKSLFHEVGEGQRPTYMQAETKLFPQKTRRPFDSIPCYRATGTDRLALLLVCCIILLQVLGNLSRWETFQVQLKYLEMKLRSMITLLSFRSKYHSLGLLFKKFLQIATGDMPMVTFADGGWSVVCSGWIFCDSTPRD